MHAQHQERHVGARMGTRETRLGRTNYVLTPLPTSAPGPGSPLPTSAPGLGSPLPPGLYRQEALRRTLELRDSEAQKVLAAADEVSRHVERARARLPSPGADVAGVSPVPVQMWRGRAPPTAVSVRQTAAVVGLLWPPTTAPLREWAL